MNDAVEALGSPAVHRSGTGVQPLGKYAAFASGVGAIKAADRHHHLDPAAMGGQISQSALVSAVDTTSATSTAWA